MQIYFHTIANGWWATPAFAWRNWNAPRKYQKQKLYKNKTNTTETWRNWSRDGLFQSEQCIRESQIDCIFTRFPLQKPIEHITAPGDALQIDLVPELFPYSGYENTVKAMDVNSSLLFAYPTSNQDAKAIAKDIFNIMTQHAARLPTTFILDKESAFLSQVIEEKAGVLGIILKHATTKQAKTIGKLERYPARIEQALKIATGEPS